MVFIVSFEYKNGRCFVSIPQDACGVFEEKLV